MPQKNTSIVMLEFNGYDVELSRKRVKNINLRIHSSGQIKLSAPIKCPLPFIYHFLNEKEEWIHKHLTRLQAQKNKKQNQKNTENHQFFLGKQYNLQIQLNASLNKVVLNETTLQCFIAAGTAHPDKMLQNWYRQEMKLLLPALIKKWEPVIGVQVQAWGIKAMKTRWGSCNVVKKKIWLNLHLIKKPIVCLEYVLVHEMVHLLEASHNKRFYALMSHFMPNWKIYKKELMNDPV